MLQNSSNYRVQAVLSKIKEYENYLQKETAILYGKLDEHEKALKIFVYTLNDYSSATEYCLRNSKDSVKQRKHLFNILFQIYMNPTYKY
jgi:vacuolar protein sorting-associated protein 3